MKQNPEQPTTTASANNPEPSTQTASKKDILRGAGIAACIATVILFTAILPAEYGFDPTGLGKLTGFKKLSEKTESVDAAKPVANHSEAETPKQETIELALKPKHGFEYKLHVKKGSAMVYSWTASTPLYYDFHGEPDAGPKGSFESFEEKTAGVANGTFVAPFEGSHGWYWTNPSSEPITIKLTVSGFYTVLGIKNEAPLKN